jgi:uncharacterized membrane protein YhaH (DUF805 family)
MSFQDAVKTVFSKYATFSGRARRSEYWWFVLFAVLVQFVTYIIDFVLFGGGRTPITTIASLAMLLPGLAVTVRRLHDIDKSGWWIFLDLVPFVGAIVLIVWFCGEGTPGPNKFGEPQSALASA